MSKLNEEKKWYIEAVESCLILRGLTKAQATALIKKYKLKERLDNFPEIQMHYDVEVAADEIMMTVA